MNKLHEEASILINGVWLTHGQAMTVRVALEIFANHLIAEGIEVDKLNSAYLDRINEIRTLLFLHEEK